MRVDETVVKEAAAALRAAGATVTVAEAATGGLVGAALSAPAGASDYFDRSYVTYSYDSLREELAVPRETLDEHGAVSEPTVAAMARAARDRARTDYGLAVAGVAGPSGGTDDRPLGTCVLGVAHAAPWGSEASDAWTERAVVDGADRTARRRGFARRAVASLTERVGEGES